MTNKRRESSSATLLHQWKWITEEVKNGEKFEANYLVKIKKYLEKILVSITEKDKTEEPRQVSKQRRQNCVSESSESVLRIY